MKKEDFFVPMDDVLNNGIHTPGNLPIEFDWKFFDSIDSLCICGSKGRLDHAYYLFHYASVLPDNSRILEIGTLKGGSAIAMGMGIRKRCKGKENDNSTILTIDPGLMSQEEIIKRKDELKNYENINEIPASNFEKFLLGEERSSIDLVMKNIRAAKLEGYIIPIPDTSINVLNRWDGRMFDMIHIDGSHRYEDVKIDCEWLRYIKKGGVAVFDDWMEPVKKAVNEYMIKHPEWELLTESTNQPPMRPWKTVFWKN